MATIEQKAAGLIADDGISEDRTARVFHARGSKGATYTVVIGANRPVCTCPAGQAARTCYHVAAAQTFIARRSS